MNTAPHTATPYKSDGRYIYASADGAHVAECGGKEDASFIVKACNAHDELVAALRDIVQISEIAVGFGVMREDANGPLPTAQRLLAKLDGAA